MPPFKGLCCLLRKESVYLLVPMLLSKALSLTASSLLGLESAPASSSFDVYLMILRTCNDSMPVSLGAKCLHTQRHRGCELFVAFEV